MDSLEGYDGTLQLLLREVKLLHRRLVRRVPEAEVGLIDEQPYLLGRLAFVSGALDQN